MPPRRVRLLLAAAILVLTAFAAHRLAPLAAAGGDAPAPVAVEVGTEGDRLIGRAPDGATVFTFDVTRWQAWATDHLAAALGDLPTIGDQTLTPDRFDRFGAAELVTHPATASCSAPSPTPC